MVPNSNARPADILLPNWCRGRQAALDVAVISPLQQLTVAEAAVTPGHALEVGVRRKLSANLPSCRAAGIECVPWWSRPLVVGYPVPYLQLKELGTSSGKESIPRTLLTPRNTCLVVSLSLSGVGMPPCGFVGFLPSHHRLMDSLKYFILFYHTFYIFALF